MKFESAEKFYDAIFRMDLYNPNIDTYVFLYNDYGSIAVYNWIDVDKANRLSQSDEYWGGQLGVGGYIHDSDWYHERHGEEPVHEAMEWCEQYYMIDGWMDTNDYVPMET